MHCQEAVSGSLTRAWCPVWGPCLSEWLSEVCKHSLWPREEVWLAQSGFWPVDRGQGQIPQDWSWEPEEQASQRLLGGGKLNLNPAKTRVQREELKLSDKVRKSKNRKKKRKKNGEGKGRWRRKGVEIGRRNKSHSEGKRGKDASTMNPNSNGGS